MIQAIAALDLIDGQVVRLYQGDYNKKTQYQADPRHQFADYVSQGATYLHLVDLTGARNPSARQLELIADLIQAVDCPIQVGGGIREAFEVQALLDAGAAKVVIGSLAVSNADKVKKWFGRFGAHTLVLALDVNLKKGVPYVATHGWQEDSGVCLYDLLDAYGAVGLKHLLCTDISRDGTLSGANGNLYRDIHCRYPNLAIQASGGIGTLADLEALKGTGVSSVIIGRALLEGRFSLKEAIACLQSV